jgi:hypothetical protein
VAVAVVAGLPAGRLPELEAAVAGSLSQLGAGAAVRPSAVRSLLASDPALAERRAAAAALLGDAVYLARRVRYDEALRKLESAETAALEGRARFTRPDLLADIYFHRGLALLPTDAGAGQRHLVQSLLLQPDRRLSPDEHAPKIDRALGEAALRAARAPLPPVGSEEATRVARKLGAGKLLIVALRAAGPDEEGSILWFDVGAGAWGRSEKVRWPTGAGRARVERALEPQIARLLPRRRARTTAATQLERTPPPRGGRRRGEPRCGSRSLSPQRRSPPAPRRW